MDVSTDATQILEMASQLGFVNDAETQARLSPSLRRLHRAVLQAFLDGPEPPSIAWLVQTARRMSLQSEDAIARLAEVDLVHLGEDHVEVAYPFSGRPTPHRVHPGGGRPVWAMCALDALGILLMAGSDGTVISADPDTGVPIRVSRSGERWQWEPEGTVMLLAFTDTGRASAEGLCPQIDFHTDAQCAEAHLVKDDRLAGQAVDQATALELADRIFGGLLDE